MDEENHQDITCQYPRLSISRGFSGSWGHREIRKSFEVLPLRLITILSVAFDEIFTLTLSFSLTFLFHCSQDFFLNIYLIFFFGPKAPGAVALITHNHFHNFSMVMIIFSSRAPEGHRRRIDFHPGGDLSPELCLGVSEKLGKTIRVIRMQTMVYH